MNRLSEEWAGHHPAECQNRAGRGHLWSEGEESLGWSLESLGEKDE